MRHLKRRIPAPALLAGLTLLLAACSSTDNGQDSLDPHGPAANQIDDLFIPILMVAIVIGVLVLLATVYAAVRFAIARADRTTRSRCTATLRSRSGGRSSPR
jgi:heme/copper-type cytochrome/quinol oxidase subunit 2